MEDIVNFFYEVGQLKRVKRSGWWLAGIDNPENIAEHSFRVAVIGYVLAKLEKVDAHKVVLMSLFQDLSEARLNDLHKVGQRYINFKEAEKKAFKEQLERLPEEMADELYDLFNQYHTDSSKEGIVARDADYLECVVQAKEYIETGYKSAQNWIDNIRKLLKTDSAKKLMDLVEKTDSKSWWKDLKKIQR